MALSPEFRDYLHELLGGLGPLTFKRMFGGAGVYLHETIFGLVFQDVLYLKGFPENEALFREAGSSPFEYPMKDGRVGRINYWSLPDTAMDDPDEAVRWARLSLR